MIDLPEYLYDRLHDIVSDDYALDDYESAIFNGRLLPKGHGRLIDVSPYEEYFNAEISYDDGDHIHTKYTNLIPTIIEADTESEGV